MAHDGDSATQLSRNYARVVANMRQVFESGRTKNASWRRVQLQRLIQGVQENTEAIAEALQHDLGGPQIRSIFDMMPIVRDAQYALDNLTEWTTPQRVANDHVVDVLSSYTVRPEPKGVTLNIAPWNFPVSLCLEPLVAAIAAGNCMVIKPSELAPSSADVVERIVDAYLDRECIKVVQGAIPETTALLEQHWDHIFYTGNGIVGRVVMHAAANHLTPVTLELGGKSPVLVDETADMTTVVNRVFLGKSTNQGQICIAPDYVIIHESRLDEFLSQFVKQVRESNFGEGSKHNPNWGKIINTRHVERLQHLIDTSGGEVVCGGSGDIDIAAQHVPFTVIKGAAPHAPIMNEEIFGPVLPVIPVKNMDDGVRMVKERERPLALYIFSADKNFQEHVLSDCTSGGAAVNTALDQVGNASAPFGGTGASGIGKYHGKHGFDELSHYRTVLYKRGSAPTMPPVEKHPKWLYDFALKAGVTGFVSPKTKQMIKTAAAGMFALGAAVTVRSRL